jgi:recombination protein RecR
MKIPSSLNKLITHFERLPGVGPKSASRLAFYILKTDVKEVQDFAKSLTDVKSNLQFCSVCKNISQGDICEVCSDKSRDQNQICVVENVLNLLAVENTGYNGLYHVLNGVLNPVNGVNAEDINIESLINRVGGISSNCELILATNPTMEGESTAMFIKRRLEQQNLLSKVSVTRIGRGIPTGGDIEFADKTTLDNALSGRVDF